MNSRVHNYYRKFAQGDTTFHPFHEVIALHECKDKEWEKLSLRIPSLVKGWYELSCLDVQDRIDFICDFWLQKLPFDPQVTRQVETFFSSLDDVGVFATQLSFDSPYECELVYSLKDESTFFRGSHPAKESEIAYLRHEFEEMLPEDFLAFLTIHNGFSRHLDNGLVKIRELYDLRSEIIVEILDRGEILLHGKVIDPSDLIPFYRSSDEKSYQCFYSAWTPEGKIGNVFCSPTSKTISDFIDRKGRMENLAFVSFMDWLTIYLGEIH